MEAKSKEVVEQGKSKEGEQGIPQSDEEDDSDASTDIEIAEQEEDRKEDDELALGVLFRLTPRKTFWKSFMESVVFKQTFLTGIDTAGSFTLLYMRYGVHALTPLVVLSLLVAFPLLVLEMTLGQYTSLNPLSLFRRMMPAFGGIGSSVVLLNLVLIGAQVQQAAIFTGLIFEAVKGGSLFKHYDNCIDSYNNEVCYIPHEEICPAHMPLLMDNQCAKWTSYTENMLGQKQFGHGNHFPFVFPLYQFLYRGIIGERAFMLVKGSFTAQAMIVYCIIWGALVLTSTRGGSGSIKRVVTTANTMLITYMLVGGIVSVYLEIPNTINVTEIAYNDLGKDTLTENGGIEMWADVATHILRHIGLGDGAMIILSSHQDFTSFILLDALILVFAFAFIPLLWAANAMARIETAVYRMLITSEDYTAGVGRLYTARRAFVNLTGSHTNMFPLALGITVYNTHKDGLMFIFGVTGFLLIIASVVGFAFLIMIRFEILMSSISDLVVGMSETAHRAVTRSLIFFGFLIMLFTVHEKGLLYFDFFYRYSLVTVIAVIVSLEVIAVLIYGWRRFFSNMSAILIIWKPMQKYRWLRVIIETVVLVIIGLIVIQPVILLSIAIHNLNRPVTVTKLKLAPFSLSLAISAVILAPIPVVLIKKMYETYTQNLKWTVMWQPRRTLWGPRTRADRELALNMEREHMIKE